MFIETSQAKISRISAIEARCIVEADSADRSWINLKRRAKRNGYNLPKQVLVDSIKRKIKEAGILRRNYEDVLVVELRDCGGKESYKTWDDIPNESVPCPCGNPTHWLIKYGYQDLRKQRRNLGR